MKNKVYLILAFSIINLSCVAQKKIISLKDNEVVMANKIQYAVKKSENKATVENVKNRFTNVKQSSPNFPENGNLFPTNVKKDVSLMTKIGASHISLKDLEELSKTKLAGIFIQMKTDLEGKILDVSFLIDNNSIISINQLEEIEHDLKSSRIITINPIANERLKGSNFILFYNSVYFEDMLNIKRGIK